MSQAVYEYFEPHIIAAWAIEAESLRNVMELTAPPALFIDIGADSFKQIVQDVSKMTTSKETSGIVAKRVEKDHGGTQKKLDEYIVATKARMEKLRGLWELPIKETEKLAEQYKNGVCPSVRCNPLRAQEQAEREARRSSSNNGNAMLARYQQS